MNECSTPESPHQFLGEIFTCVIDIQPHHAPLQPCEQVSIEREPGNVGGKRSIRIENGHSELAGFLPRRTASWLATLIDRGDVHVEAYVPQSALPKIRTHRTRVPLALMVFLTEQGRRLMVKPDPHGTPDLMHKLVSQVCQEASQSHDAKRVAELAAGLHALRNQDLLPETRLLLALFPAIAQQVAAWQNIRVLGGRPELDGQSASLPSAATSLPTTRTI
jgi:hypothetical protein